MSKDDRLERITRLKEEALLVLRERGEWKDIKGAGKMLGASVGNLRMVMHTPFSRVPELTSQMKYIAATDNKPILPYGMDIWAEKKVLSIEWNEEGALNVISFKPGDWEMALTAGPG